MQSQIRAEAAAQAALEARDAWIAAWRAEQQAIQVDAADQPGSPSCRTAEGPAQGVDGPEH